MLPMRPVSGVSWSRSVMSHSDTLRLQKIQKSNEKCSRGGGKYKRRGRKDGGVELRLVLRAMIMTVGLRDIF